VIPDDLAAWFDGKPILADRYNLPRIRSVWRVIEMLAVLGDEEYPYVVKGESRQFRSHKGAVAYRDRLVAEGKVALIQAGIEFWLDDDEWADVTEHEPAHERKPQAQAERVLPCGH
jgi:hypothetical protein